MYDVASALPQRSLVANNLLPGNCMPKERSVRLVTKTKLGLVVLTDTFSDVYSINRTHQLTYKINLWLHIIIYQICLILQ